MNDWKPIPSWLREWCLRDGLDELPWPPEHRRGTWLSGKVRSPVDAVDTKLLLYALMSASSMLPACSPQRLIPAVAEAPPREFDLVRSRHWRCFVSEAMVALATDPSRRRYLATTREYQRDGFVVVNTTSRHREVVEQVWPEALIRQGWTRAWPEGIEPVAFIKSPVDGVEPEEIIDAARAAANRRHPFRAALTELLEAIAVAPDREAVDNLLEGYRVLMALRN